jgi:hypothetical protein
MRMLMTYGDVCGFLMRYGDVCADARGHYAGNVDADPQRVERGHECGAIMQSRAAPDPHAHLQQTCTHTRFTTAFYALLMLYLITS